MPSLELPVYISLHPAFLCHPFSPSPSTKPDPISSPRRALFPQPHRRPHPIAHPFKPLPSFSSLLRSSRCVVSLSRSSLPAVVAAAAVAAVAAAVVEVAAVVAVPALAAFVFPSGPGPIWACASPPAPLPSRISCAHVYAHTNARTPALPYVRTYSRPSHHGVP